MRNSKSLIIALAVILCAGELWFSEGNLTPPEALWTAVAGLVVSLAIGVGLFKRWSLKLVGAVILMILSFGCFYIGRVSFNSAYFECIERGEEVRIQLEQYRTTFHKYPDRLSDLDSVDMCSRLMRPTILEYRKTKDGYTLIFQDWLIPHIATESEPFLAHK